jgi:oligosaccharide translocation protein RFT1
MKSEMYQISIISILKLLLSEIEKLVLISLSNPSTVGQFQMISNLGSLIPRLIFAPTEEISFNLIARMKSSGSDLLEIFCLIIRFPLLVGVFTLFFGVPYMKGLIFIVLGDNWTNDVIIYIIRFII